MSTLLARACHVFDTTGLDIYHTIVVRGLRDKLNKQQTEAVYVDSTDSCSDAATELERVKLGVGWNLSVT